MHTTTTAATQSSKMETTTTTGNGSVSEAEAKCLGMIKAEQTRESKLAGLLLLLHLLKNTQVDRKQLADRAFGALDEDFLADLASNAKSLELCVSVSQTLARLSTSVSSDPKLWRVAQKGLSVLCAQMAQTSVEGEEEDSGKTWDDVVPVAVAEDTLELVEISLQSLKVVEDTRPECPQYLEDAVKVLVSLGGTAQQSGSELDKQEAGHQRHKRMEELAMRVLSAALGRMSSERKGLAILNVGSFQEVTRLLVEISNEPARKSKGREASSDKAESFGPLEAITALSHWLHPECVIGKNVNLASEEWLEDLQKGLCLGMQSSVRVQGDCIQIAAGLSKAFGVDWILNHRTKNPDASFERGGFAYLILLTAKTEISILLSDALQPESEVWEGMTAGDRASAHLGNCFAVTDQAIQLVAQLADKEQDDLVQDYFMVLHDLVGVVIDYFVEVSKNPSEYRKEIL